MKILSFIIFAIVLFSCSESMADSRLDRCLPYYEQITTILEDENVSTDYFYLAVCESGCKVKESTKGARGFFQLMPATFNVYKDKDCSDIDDIRCNTIAAARYIKHLQKRFKDMSILVKAYNRGGTNLLRKGTTREANGLSYCVMRLVKSRGKS